MVVNVTDIEDIIIHNRLDKPRHMIVKDTDRSSYLTHNYLLPYLLT